ncbi:MAG TPA: hypothetical protein VD883_04590 [Candidatus Omnitrophota bacterium]|nr:hypothetical protein [Candidatus Omnitrophota bacterium]
MRKKSAILLLSVLLAAGCATGYQKQDMWGYGYHETKLQDDVYRIDFEGGADSEMTQIKDFALLRCAEFSIQNGYKYFVILERTADNKVSVVETPGYEFDDYYYDPVRPYILRPRYRRPTTYSVFTEPSVSNIIQGYRERPTNVNNLVYDAQKILENLKGKYKLK